MTDKTNTENPGEDQAAREMTRDELIDQGARLIADNLELIKSRAEAMRYGMLADKHIALLESQRGYQPGLDSQIDASIEKYRQADADQVMKASAAMSAQKESVQ